MAEFWKVGERLQDVSEVQKEDRGGRGRRPRLCTEPAELGVGCTLLSRPCGAAHGPGRGSFERHQRAPWTGEGAGLDGPRSAACLGIVTQAGGLPGPHVDAFRKLLLWTMATVSCLFELPWFLLGEGREVR